MQVRCVRAFGLHKPGDEIEVPDGATVDPCHYEPAVPAPPEAETAPAPEAAPATVSFPSKGM